MPLETGKVDNTLAERGAVYGDYAGGMRFRLAIVGSIKARFEEVNGCEMLEADLMLFNDVIGKLSRLASSPSHIDSWHDLAGYSLLVEKVLKGEES